MKKPILITIIALLVGIGISGIWLFARPEAPSPLPEVVSPAPSPGAVSPAPASPQTPSQTLGIIGTPSVFPSVVIANTPTPITVTISITDPSLIAGSVNLQRLGPSGQVVAILGNLRDDGLEGDAVAGDKVFTIQLDSNESSAGQVRLQVSAAFQGLLRRVTSTVLLLRALPPTGIFSSPSLGVSFVLPAGWNVLERDKPVADDPTLEIISVTSPNGSKFLVLPKGGEGYGLGDEVDEIVSEISVSGFTARRRDFHLTDDTLVLTRIELSGVPNAPEYRVEFRIQNPLDLPALEAILQSLVVSPR